MKRAVSILLGALVVVCGAQDRLVAQGEQPSGSSFVAAPPGQEEALRAALAEFTKAYNAGDAEAVAALFAEDAEVTAPDGSLVAGRRAIGRQFAERLGRSPGETIEIAVESLRFLAPDVAREVGRSTTKPASGKAGTPESGPYRALYVRRDGRWLVAEVHEMPEAGPQDPAVRLKELEWLVGEWVDESPGATVSSVVEWDEGKRFLVRRYSVQVEGKAALSGTQRIGLDPLTGQFKSWVFESGGGYGEGLWARHGDGTWVIKAEGVMADGRTATATQVLSRIDGERMRWSSLDRTVGDGVGTDLDEIILVRKPPQPRK